MVQHTFVLQNSICVIQIFAVLKLQQTAVRKTTRKNGRIFVETNSLSMK